ncbi:MAG: glycoside hydrolase family 97 protein [Bacteroidaceae bacterium]|nr:glycoside hydrolase family 97 protein [Bacteroidaceae bacterium]
MKKTPLLCTLAALLTLCCLSAQAQKTLSLTSPDGTISVTVSLGEQLTYTVAIDDETVMQDNAIALTLGNKTLGAKPKLSKKSLRSVKETLTPAVPMKNAKVDNHYNLLRLDFSGNYAVEFRAYDDAVAYRFVTRQKGTVDVMDELCEVNLAAAANLHMQEPGSFHCNNEERYTHHTVAEWAESGKLAELPLLIDTPDGHRILLSESGLLDYAGMFVKPNGTRGVVATFPHAPLEFAPNSDRSVHITKEADYIARTSGTRAFPWRYFVITRDDETLAQSTIATRLAPASVLDDTSWIKPGQVSWEWWNDASPYGPDVEFVSGYNLETYKYFIDFAQKYGIEYILMDEGWAKDTRDPFTPNPNVDLHELIRYGQERGVGIVLWLTWLTVDNHMDLFETFAQWGVKGVKIDFMDRSDQWMVNFYERVAARAAQNHLFVDFHGAYRPAGLEGKYPNVLSYEGVLGMEQGGRCVPDNSLWLPFMRNICGPMDYTPGAMLSYQPNNYAARRPNNGSTGTRAYQMALFVIFESGLQMLADNPTLYYRNDDCTRYISSVPVTWDETRVLEAKAGELIVEAKRKSTTWYIAGITNNSQDERVVTLPLDFLTAGSHQLELFTDGINAGRQAMDYRRKESTVTPSDVLTIKVVRNGGFAGIIK